MSSEDAARLIENTVSAFVLFDVAGVLPEKRYKQLARLVHPDRASVIIGKVRADAVFSKLSSLYASLNGKVAKTTIAGWVVDRPLAKGDIADLYLIEPDSVLKIARSSADNDLMLAETQALTKLRAADPRYDKLKRYVPQLRQTFKADQRQANVISLAPSSYSLKDLLQIFPKGSLEFRHVVWMMNRLLSAIGLAHSYGICHGAILPEHLIYIPDNHGLLLVDWCYSVRGGEAIKAIVKDREKFYAPEVRRKKLTTESTDLYAAFACFRESGFVIPKRFVPLFDLCLLGSQKSRPNDAWEIQERWLGLAREEYGEPRFVKLVIPVS